MRIKVKREFRLLLFPSWQEMQHAINFILRAQQLPLSRIALYEYLGDLDEQRSVT